MEHQQIADHFDLVEREPVYSCRYCGASVAARFLERHLESFLHPFAGRGGFFNQSVSFSVYYGVSAETAVLDYLRAGFNVHLKIKVSEAN